LTGDAFACQFSIACPAAHPKRRRRHFRGRLYRAGIFPINICPFFASNSIGLK
jgi:hypothetical protein